jgi:hypothetical protein
MERPFNPARDLNNPAQFVQQVESQSIDRVPMRTSTMNTRQILIAISVALLSACAAPEPPAPSLEAPDTTDARIADDEKKIAEHPTVAAAQLTGIAGP